MNIENNQIIKVAINVHFLNKEPKDGDERSYSKGWQNDELTVDEFISCIRKLPHQVDNSKLEIPV